ncbi:MULTISPECIES: hypothetical protein [unclassified Ruegeria]|uniref:hypothetical protein n=1 Tax=unclassified Ruegeria TaxID=2625375 RepID=UPI0014894417|nr:MULTISPECIES: hypothetical protein [unclassified Ruegeria]
MDTDILEMLDSIGRNSLARLTPAVYLNGDTAQDRRNGVLKAIRGTILPRRLEFTAANDLVLAIEVNSSRITDIFSFGDEPTPDFETESREALTEVLARMVTDIAMAPGPLELVSLRPDNQLEADDVGITYSEIAAACAGMEISEEPIMTIVPDAPEEEIEPEPNVEPVEAVETEPTSPSGMAHGFYTASDRFAEGRILLSDDDGEGLELDGLCAEGQSGFPEQELLQSFAKDLAGWKSDSEGALTQPQLIVVRASGGQGTGLSILCDGAQTAITLHEARKLGAVVNLWRSLQGVAE